MYLTEEETARLASLASVEGCSQADIIRRAIDRYEPVRRGDRHFAMTGSGRGPGTSIADIAEEELLAGFGED